MSRHERISVVRLLNQLIGRLEYSKRSLLLGKNDRVVSAILEAQREGKTNGDIKIGSGAAHCLL